MEIFTSIKFVLVLPFLFKFLELNCIPVKGQVVDGTKAIHALLKNPSLELSRFGLKTESGQGSHDYYYKTDISLKDYILENITSVMEVLGNLSGRSNGKSKLLISIQYKLSQKSLHDYPEFTSNAYSDRMDYRLSMSQLSKIHKPSIGRISRVAVNWQNMPCSKQLTYSGQLEWLFKNLNSTLKVGVSYDKSHLGCRFAKRDVKRANFVIFTVEFSQDGFVASYGIFKRYMNHLSQENEKYLRYTGSSATEILYLVEFSQHEGDNDKNIELQSYQKLLLNYSLEWASEEHKTVIVDPFILSKPEASTEESTVLQNFKLPSAQFEILDSGTSILEGFEIVSKSFKEVFIDPETWKCLSSCWDYHQKQLDKVSIRIGECFCGDLGLWDKINISVSVFTRSTISEQELKFTENLHLGGITLGKIAFYSDDEVELYYDSQSFKVVVSKELSKRVKIACVNGGDIFDRNHTVKVDEFCQVLLKEKIAESWILYVDIDMNEVEMYNDEYFYNSKNIIHQLNMFNMEREIDLEQYPEITVSLMMAPSKPTKVLLEESPGLYCSENVLQMNEIVEGISNWAVIHNVTLIFGSAIEVNDIDAFTWQRRIYPSYEIAQEEGTFFTVMQNFPKSMDNVGSQSCIQKISIFPKDGIRFNENVGVTVNLNLKSGLLSSQEIGTMLMYAFYKFDSIQIQLGNDVKSMESLIKAWNLLPSEFEGVQGKIFIQVELPEDKNSRKVYLEKVEKLVSVLNSLSVRKCQVGVHAIKSADQLISQDVENLLEIRKVTFQIGLSFPNCASELKEFLTNSTLKFPKEINYVICEEKVVVGLSADKNKMTKLLDGHLAMEKVFKKIAPEVEVTFNIQTFPGMKSDGKESSADLLNFIFDVNEFAGIFQLNYFACPAFDNNRTGESGWWRIKSFQDLTNYSTYQETESEILNVKPWRPIGSLRNASTTATPPNIAKWVIPAMASLGGGFLVVVLIAGILGIIGRKNSRILSDEEVQDFLEGKKFLATQSRNDSCLDYAVLKFDEFLEIPKSELHLESAKILGTGNFGMVYQALVRGENVAVKVPHDGCSKESFKSMLTEVKLLCYIGDHINVIKFVGAYTKEIQKGVIYIVTTLCENGSLQSYLREKQKQNRDEQVDMDVMARELIQFSKEIASGMAYIASRNVVHGDLSTRNVLLDEHKTCKIADFGLSRKLYEYNKYVKKSQEPLPWRWMAFESLKMMEFTTKSDVWSYGITLWEIFTLGDTPYPGLSWSVNFVEDIGGGMRMEKPLFASEDIFAKISSCWNLDPKERPAFEELRDFFVSRMNSEYRDLNEV